MQVPDIARLGVAIIGALTFLFFAIRTNDDWKGMSRGRKFIHVGIAVLISVAAWGTLEVMTIRPPIELGIRNLALPIGLSCILFGLWLVRREQSPISGGWIKASEVAQILNDIEGEDSEAGLCHNPACIKARIRLRAKIAHAEHRL